MVAFGFFLGGADQLTRTATVDSPSSRRRKQDAYEMLRLDSGDLKKAGPNSRTLAFSHKISFLADSGSLRLQVRYGIFLSMAVSAENFITLFSKLSYRNKMKFDGTFTPNAKFHFIVS